MQEALHWGVLYFKSLFEIWTSERIIFPKVIIILKKMLNVWLYKIAILLNRTKFGFFFSYCIIDDCFVWIYRIRLNVSLQLLEQKYVLQKYVKVKAYSKIRFFCTTANFNSSFSRSPLFPNIHYWTCFGYGTFSG